MEVHKIQKKSVARRSTTTLSLGPRSGSELSSQNTTDSPSTPTEIDTHIAIDHASGSERDTAGLDPQEHLITENRDHLESVGQDTYVKWGIAWKTPFLMVLWALAGLGWAVGHHFYYQSLDGTKTGSPSRQNWALRFGTAFSFLVITCLRASCDIVYKQYIWTLFKRKGLSLRTVDGLFAATQDPFALMSLEFLRHAKVAYLVALICWCMALPGVAPPATLSVVPGFSNHTETVSGPSLDWNSTKFYDMESPADPAAQVKPGTGILPFAVPAAQPSSEVLRIAALAAESMAVIPPTPPAVNSSFHVQFFGPSMQCSLANSFQEAAFNTYTHAMANSSVMKVTKSLFESDKLKWGEDGIPGGTAPLMSVYSAFSPWSGSYGWLFPGSPSLDYSVDAFNNWIPDTPSIYHTRPDNIPQQLWIQTSDQGIVCTLGNASFDVWFEFVNAVQTKVEYSITKFTTFTTPTVGYMVTPMFGADLASTSHINSYMAMYLAFSGLLNGNVSTTLTNQGLGDGGDHIFFDGNVTIYEGSSKILQHGLSACDEILNGYWTGDNVIGIGQDGPVPWKQAAAALHWHGYQNSTNADGDSMRVYDIDTSVNFSRISNKLFTKPTWMCRNRTLARAVEDLANNFTISMLSSTLAKQNATSIDALMFSAINVYSYNSRNLLVSYSIALCVTLLCAVVGFFALQYNGVAHSSAFSAIVSTTRNDELLAMSRGHSLGAVPVQHTNMKIRFGEIMTVSGKEWNNGHNREDGRHIGFGAAEHIIGLKKGAKYV